jgi:xanthine dehydrogenase accessory factor
MNEPSYYEYILKMQSENHPIWQAIIVETDGSTPAKPGMKLLIPLKGDCHGNLGGGEMEHNTIGFVRENRPQDSLCLRYDLGKMGSDSLIPTQMICGGTATVFIEPLFVAKELYIFGAGHCGKALGSLAKSCGFWVHLVDNRRDILDSAPPNTHHQSHFSDFCDIYQELLWDENSWLVIMTHGHTHDAGILEQCLRQKCRYLGMIGSKSKVIQSFADLKDKGFTDEQLARVHAPIGIKIGSQSPSEIAISIMAEIIGIYRNAAVAPF